MKKVLFVTYDFPYPTDSGGKTRAYNLLKFSGQGLEISLLSFTRQNPTKKSLEKIHDIGIKNIYTVKRNKKRDIKSLLKVITKNSIFKSLYFDKNTQKKIREIAESEKIDIIHFESYYTAFYIDKYFKKSGIRQILGTENIEHQLYQLFTEKKAPFLTRPILRREVRKIEKEEISMIQNSDVAVAVTEKECSFIKKNGGKNCTVVENGVDINFFKKIDKKKESKKILFVGNFSYFPNTDAMKYFYNDVFPHLPSEIEMHVVGKNYKSLGIKDKRIKFTEFVPDIRDAYSQCFAMVSPIRIGGGTNFKILEAMASKTVVIADPARVDDIGAENNEEILVAENPEKFKEKIIKVYENKKLREKIESKAFEFVGKKYSWENIGKKLNKVWIDA